MFTPVRIGIALMVATLVVTGVIELPTVLAWRPEPLPMKAVAVLPFRNIGSEADDGFLGEAIHQELLTQLGNVPRLRVIARGSVVDYRIDFDDDRTIAEALGVRYLIRGAIQVSGDRVRVWARLIDVTTAEQLWGSSYDAAREDLFPVQVQIAGQVAEALDVGSRVALWARSTPPSTANAEAYESYLRGRLHATRVVNQSDAREAVRLFENAVTLDPGFGPAYAALSRSRLLLGYVFDDPDQMAQSGAALRQAVALAPGDSDTWLAEAYHFAYWAQDYDSALDRLGRILTVRPSDADALSLKGFIERRQGSWEDAVATMTAALQVDPNAYTTTVVLAEMLMRMREYRRAERLLDRAIAISPGGEAAYVQKALLYLNGWGDTAGARDVLDAAPVAFSSKNRVLPALTAVFRGDAVGALEWLHRPQGGQDDTARSFGELHLLGLIYRLRGDDSRAAAYGDSIGQILAEARRSTGRVRAVTGVLRLAESSSYSAVAAALSADDDEAVREAEGAAALLPLSTDAYAGTEILERLAEVYALTDRNAAAIQVLHLLLSVPSRVTPHVLRLHPAYERLQADPAFLALLDQYPDVLQD